MSVTIECRQSIQKVNEELSKLEKAQRIKDVDPKIEKQLKYYMNEKDKNDLCCQRQLDALNDKIQPFNDRIEREKKEFDEKIASYIEKTERTKRELDEKLASYIEKNERAKKELEYTLTAFLDKIDREKKDIESKKDEKNKYYETNITSRSEIGNDPVYNLKKDELIRERDRLLLEVKEHEENEEYMRNAMISEQRRREKKAKGIYMNGQYYSSEKAYADYLNIDKQIREHNKHIDTEKEILEELKARQLEDKLEEVRLQKLKELNLLYPEGAVEE